MLCIVHMSKGVGVKTTSPSARKLWTHGFNSARLPQKKKIVCKIKIVYKSGSSRLEVLYLVRNCILILTKFCENFFNIGPKLIINFSLW